MKIFVDEILGSESLQLEQTGPNAFRAILAPSRGLPLVPNMLQFRCQGCAHHEIEIETLFSVENPRGKFDEYPHCATPDFERFLPLEWSLPLNGARNILRVPPTGWDDFRVGMQAVYPNALVKRHMGVWAQHPHATHETLGTSTQGLPIHALRVHDPDGIPRWRHWIVNQHPGEGNARWRIKGMVDDVLSDNPLAAQLRRNAEILFIPLLCPDGPANGWRRVNADGVDMNRCFRMEGPDPRAQIHEAFLLQHRLETEKPHTLWNMHTWPGLTEPVLDNAGPELGHATGTVEELIALFARIGESHLKPLRKREKPGASTTWNGGAGQRLGMTSFLIEGGGEPAQPHPHLEAGKRLAQILAMFWGAGFPAHD
ncbi:MAG: hypothetical protein JJU29_04820 [Verrucomicrobia bacterium]|nr:hypothetical protein [Verrucomicrobiota bacterium]MCH8510269.1 hypothetical protein [Kiritimatiellia bacterium]